MGLLSWLFGQRNQGPQDPSKGDAVDGKKVPSPHKPFHEEINIDGDCPTQIYTYLGVIFKGIKKGEEFYVDVVDHDVELHSRSTGTTIDTAEWETTAVSYNGRAFGSLGSGLEYLKDVAAAGFRFRLKVKKVGMYSAGIPELVALTINKQALREWWDRQSESTEFIPIDEDELMESVKSRWARQRFKKGADE